MKRFDREDVIPVLVVVGAFIAFAFVFWLLVLKPDPAGAAGGSVEKPAVFDHSNCQYPNRPTNPPDGCDNTDPACPAEIKGGSCDKVDVPTVSKPKAAPAASQKQTASNCME